MKPAIINVRSKLRYIVAFFGRSVPRLRYIFTRRQQKRTIAALLLLLLIAYLPVIIISTYDGGGPHVYASASFSVPLFRKNARWSIPVGFFDVRFLLWRPVIPYYVRQTYYTAKKRFWFSFSVLSEYNRTCWGNARKSVLTLSFITFKSVVVGRRFDDSVYEGVCYFEECSNVFGGL